MINNVIQIKSQNKSYGPHFFYFPTILYFMQINELDQNWKKKLGSCLGRHIKWSHIIDKQGNKEEHEGACEDW